MDKKDVTSVFNGGQVLKIALVASLWI